MEIEVEIYSNDEKINNFVNEKVQSESERCFQKLDKGWQVKITKNQKIANDKFKNLISYLGDNRSLDIPVIFFNTQSQWAKEAKVNRDYAFLNRDEKGVFVAINLDKILEDAEYDFYTEDNNQEMILDKEKNNFRDWISPYNLQTLLNHENIHGYSKYYRDENYGISGLLIYQTNLENPNHSTILNNNSLDEALTEFFAKISICMDSGVINKDLYNQINEYCPYRDDKILDLLNFVENKSPNLVQKFLKTLWFAKKTGEYFAITHFLKKYTDLNFTRENLYDIHNYELGNNQIHKKSS
jgi:hypothetical protein